MPYMNRAYRAVETLVGVDPEFSSLCKSLYGTVDTELIYEDIFGSGVIISKDLLDDAISRSTTPGTPAHANPRLRRTGHRYAASAAAAPKPVTATPKVGEMAEGAYQAQKLTLPKALQGDVANKIGHALHKPIEHKKLTGAFLGTAALASAHGKRKGRRQGYEDALYGKLDDSGKRKLTAAGSFAGAGVGAYGLGVAANEIRGRAKEAGSLRAGIKATPKMTKWLIPAEVAGVGIESYAGHLLHGDAKKKPVFQPTGVRKYYSEIRPATKEELAANPVRGGFLRLRKKPAKQGWMQATEDRVQPYLLSTSAGNPDYTAKQVKRFSRHVTPVEKAAPDLELAGTFSKFDDEKRQAFGYASVVKKDGLPVVDRQGDYIDMEEMEKAAYHYVQKSRVGGDMHRRQADEFGIDRAHHVSDLIESMVFTPEKCQAMGLPDEVAKKLEGHWWVGYQIHDEDTWEQVRKQGRTGFSVHGRGKRVETTLDEVIERVNAAS